MSKARVLCDQTDDRPDGNYLKLLRTETMCIFATLLFKKTVFLHFSVPFPHIFSETVVILRTCYFTHILVLTKMFSSGTFRALQVWV